MRPLLLTGLGLLALVGCQKAAPPADTPAPGAAAGSASPKAATAKAQAATSPASAPAGDPAGAPAKTVDFELRVIPGSGAAGAPSESVVEVTPKPGFKMNLDFPARLRLTAHPGLTPAKTELAQGDAELSEQALRFKVSHTAQGAGAHAVEGLADFSVCNEKACKLIRGEKVAWTVKTE